MRFSTIAAAAIALAQTVVALKTVKLKTFAYPPPQYPDVTGKFVSAWHEGAALNYLVVVPEEGATTWTYDEETKYLYFEVGAGSDNPFKFYFTIGEGEPGILLATPTDHPVPVNIDNLGFITFDGSYGVKGVKNINDPYNYSKDNYILAKYDGVAPDDAVPIFFQALAA
ncbi:Cell wall protein PGA31 [Candida viswanathii]|uniref:Cell wall protein PGA31 n=1 Tax=Candida viswanathii TaxID=5486 RepID=A0A367XUX7_9ASCO|nr:Cell wall protein PGA31 [Candida viswanathii]